MVVAATAFGLMAFSAKIACARLSGPEVAMIRMAVGLLPCIVVPRYRRYYHHHHHHHHHHHSFYRRDY